MAVSRLHGKAVTCLVYNNARVIVNDTSMKLVVKVMTFNSEFLLRLLPLPLRD